MAFARSPEYRIEERLGSGSSSEVFAAVVVTAQGFEKRVAIKRPKQESDLEQFFEEARLVAQLDHPSIVEVLDFGLWDGTPFQVLEYVQGFDLSNAIAKSKVVPPEVALYVTYEVASTLDYVHHAKNAGGLPLRIVHRDINPSNIMVTKTGHVKVADFGIARAYRRRRDTTVGTAKGTLAFMAPEQLRMEEVDSRTDIFALGCVLCTMLTGGSPLDVGSIRDDLVAGIDFEPTGPMPEAAKRIVANSMRARPIDRYARGAEVADACFEALKSFGHDPRRATAAWLESLGENTAERESISLDMVLETNDEGTRVFSVVERSPHFRDVQPTATDGERTRIVRDVGGDMPTLRDGHLRRAPAEPPEPAPTSNAMNPVMLGIGFVVVTTLVAVIVYFLR